MEKIKAEIQQRLDEIIEDDAIEAVNERIKLTNALAMLNGEITPSLG